MQSRRRHLVSVLDLDNAALPEGNGPTRGTACSADCISLNDVNAKALPSRASGWTIKHMTHALDDQTDRFGGA